MAGKVDSATTIKEAVKEIDPEIMGDLDDILETQDSKFLRLHKNLAALIGFKASVLALARSLDKMITSRERELYALRGRHRIRLTPKDQEALMKVYEKYAKHRYSPTMKSLEQHEKDKP
jgi:hypothetical protein